MRAPDILLGHLRAASPDMVEVFTLGGCYRLYKVLKTAFPSAKCWYDQVDCHVYTEIDGVFYDIRGRHPFNPKWVDAEKEYGMAKFENHARKWRYCQG